MITLVRDRLLERDARSGAILDGFPRTVDQAKSLDRMLSDLGRRVDAVIYLRVPIEAVLERVAKRITCPQCGAVYHLQSSPPRIPGRCDVCGGELYQRTDDQPDVVQRRLEVYELQTAPLVELYRGRGVLLEVDGSRPANQVLDNELQALAGLGIAAVPTRG
jgi:adenylate kinase